MNNTKLSIVIPARNEANALEKLLPAVLVHVPGAEVIVVDDGSEDETAKVAAAAGARVISHPYPKGNGAAIKSGARAARGEVVVFMDGDGQHQASDIPRLLEKIEAGYDMVVGARQRSTHAGVHRAVANDVFSRLASWMVMQRIDDLTSGFRAVHAEKFRQFLYLLPNGFSYPTTITMSFFRAGYSVGYVPIQALQRLGRSHIRPLRDGVRFLLIIIRIGTLYSPQKLFLPISAGFFLLGTAQYVYTYLTSGRFTNMGALLFIAAILTFLIGIVSEQISALHYRDLESRGGRQDSQDRP